MYWNIQKITLLMLEAGEIAISNFRKVQAEVKPDNSLVTDADIKIEQFLKDNLEDCSKEIYFIGEESILTENKKYFSEAMHHHCFIVDPIDGTANYANGIELWGISIGYMSRGCLLHGAIYLPKLNTLYITNESDVECYEVIDGRVGLPRVCSLPAGPSENGLLAVTQKIVKNYKINSAHPIHALSVAVYPLVHILMGRYIAYVGKLKLWDIAGAMPMLKRVGLDVYLWSGLKINDKIDNDVVHMSIENANFLSLKGMVLVCRRGDRVRIMEKFIEI